MVLKVVTGYYISYVFHYTLISVIFRLRYKTILKNLMLPNTELKGELDDKKIMYVLSGVRKRIYVFALFPVVRLLPLLSLIIVSRENMK